MAKELIVSVNGREKKIAIIENEQVTEFYIERGEENQGIVGNIYKGRVQRVLPGMQSAFVNIGLERDAFLYVSDFFDEEEEFERIVIDKSKGADAAARQAAERAAAATLEQARIEREHRIEATQERAEPLLEAEASTAASITDATPISTSAPRADESLSAAASIGEPERAVKDSNQRRSRRDRDQQRRRDRSSSARQIEPATNETDNESAITTSAVGHIEANLAQAPSDESRAATPFAANESSFERVVDDEAEAVEDGSMLKDARLQERLFDQIHAVEFDLEEAPPAAVGSLPLPATSAANSFQRIDDNDIAPTGEASAPAAQPNHFVQQTVAAHVTAFVDEIAEATAASSQPSFERVSDDDAQANEAAPPIAATLKAVAEEPTAPNSDLPFAEATQEGTAAPAQAAAMQSPEASSEATLNIAPAAEEANNEQAPAPKRSRRATGAKQSAAKSAAKKSAATRSKSATGATKSRTRRASASSDENRLSAKENGADAIATGNATNDASFQQDAEASVSTPPARGEFATRRGGRRRRRPGSGSSNGKPAGHEAANGSDNDAAAADRGDNSNGAADAVLEFDEEPIQAASTSTVPAANVAIASAPSALPAREHGGRRQSRDERASNERNQRGGGNRRESNRPPTITDLLREGQEILVQIAKEPIAKKGARITSHIALPGRFLVYMPTVEHVGVSRKIESDAERARLRKLIQAIRNEEDVPSGGFIVRTAGVGISEEDLRNDARYLVRTWLDIRRDAEKTKAPALVHRDLDLVQRILRDQLSDDFDAIRVDSEEEYLRIVEFVNRIQPRLVKRVKLYTREQPILEAYGVQAEVDKAIKPRVWLKSGGYLVINQTEALVSIDVNTGKFVGRGGSRLEDTITKTNLEAVEEIVRQIRLRDLGGIIVLDLIDMEDRRNRNRVMQTLQEALQGDKSPTKVLSFNDFGLVIMTRKRVKQSLERTLCAPCPYCTGAGLVKSPQTICYEILEEARRLSRSMNGDRFKQTTLRLNPEVARALRASERDVLTEIEDYLGAVDITSDPHIHQEQFDFAFI